MYLNISGIQSTIHHLPEDTSQSTLLSLVNQLNIDPDVDGILVQVSSEDIFGCHNFQTIK